MNQYADRNASFSKKVLEIWLNFQQVIQAHACYFKSQAAILAKNHQAQSYCTPNYTWLSFFLPSLMR
jgi:hypothetical protein